MKLLNFLLLCSLLATTGCNTTNLANSIDGALARAAGNKTPAFFKVANLETMNDYVFNMNGYTIVMPMAKEIDFRKHDGWMGLTHYNKDITLYLEGFYHITVSTDNQASDYGDRARAIEAKDQLYIKRIREKYKYSKSTKLYYGTYGKENYLCIVKERVDKFKRHKVSYDCYKPNPSRIIYRNVTISLTYTKPKDPTLAKQYTYEDLKNRAKRMLDSLCIKDGW